MTLITEMVNLHFCFDVMPRLWFLFFTALRLLTVLN